MLLSYVVAVAENAVIGRANQLPWRLPSDLKRFKALTMGKPLIMGRKTYDSIGRPLPGRVNIVVSRQRELSIPGCTVVTSLEEAIVAAGPVPEVVLIGGAELFRQALPRVGVIHLTRVHAAVPGDVLFPTLDPCDWSEVLLEHHAADDRNEYSYSFLQLTRK